MVNPALLTSKDQYSVGLVTVSSCRFADVRNHYTYLHSVAHISTKNPSILVGRPLAIDK